MQDAWTVRAREYLESSEDSAPLCDVPEKVTASGRAFYVSLEKTLLIPLLFSDVSVFADNAASVAKKIVDEKFADLPSGFNPFVRLESSGGPFQRRLNSLSDVLCEMTVVRVSDNLTSYFSEIVRECLRSKPEIMRSSETVTVESVLRAESMDELREFLINKKVDELAYLGFSKLVDWIAERLGMQSLPALPALSFLSELIETRNCIVHARGIVNAKYIRSYTGATKPSLGGKIHVDIDMVYLAARATAECVASLDVFLAKKFNLPIDHTVSRAVP